MTLLASLRRGRSGILPAFMLAARRAGRERGGTGIEKRAGPGSMCVRGDLADQDGG